MKNGKLGRQAVFWGALLCATVTLGQTSTLDGVYSTEQAAAGAERYGRICGECHGIGLRGGEAGPALLGNAFWDKWGDQPLVGLFQVMRTTMPVSGPNGLTASQYAELQAFILQQNGLPAGEQALPVETAELAAITLERPSEPVQVVRNESRAPVERVINAEWLSYHNDTRGTHYAPISQVNRDNVQNLEIAWRWFGANHGPIPEVNYEATPLMVDGVLYTTAGLRRDVVAIDPVTGETLWMYRFDEGSRRGPRVNSGRGLSLWREAGRQDGETRLFVVTPGYQMLALDADTGELDTQFGDAGIIDLRDDLEDRFEIGDMPVGLTSPPVVVGDVIVVGAAFPSGGAPPTMRTPAGNIRGYDVHSGELLWKFHTIPQEGEFGTETWRDDSYQYTGNAGAWAVFTADQENGIVYVPVEGATHDMYGGHRPGDNLFSQSLVALDAKSGERIWHFQFVHHDVWDYDPPTGPVLADIVVDGEEIPAAIQVTKQGLVFTFNRLTGEPVWPIEERPVPQNGVAGEQLSPTQPFPTRPAPFERTGLTEDDLIDFTPELKQEAQRIISEYTYGPLYTPPSLVSEDNRGSIFLPGFGGGANWQGAALDPQTNILYVPSTTHPMRVGLGVDKSISEMDYVMQIQGGFVMPGPYGLPLTKPPYGRITAIDMNTGEHLWMMANADTPEEIADHPRLQGIELPRTGHGDRGGLLVTESLLFAGEGAGIYGGQTGGGRMFRAHDKATGEILFEMELPAKQTGLPMTYMIDDEQYIVVPVGEPGHPGELVALKLGQ